MRAKTFSVLGESQFGKSSFINMISGRKGQAVGAGNGKSCTSQVTAVNFQDVLGIFQTNAQLCCLDVPGFDDTSLTITNRQTLNSIKLTLTENKYTRLDALFVFQSASESALRLAKLFSTAESLFGPTIVRSCVIIATKSDMVPPHLLPRRTETIESFAREKNVPVVWWVNDSDEPVSSEDKQKQAASLNTALARVQPYIFTDMQKFERLIKNKAEELMRTDPKNKVHTQVNVPYDVSVTYNVNEAYYVPVTRLKFTEQEVINQARNLQSLPQNKEPYYQTVKKVERVKKYETYTVQQRYVWREWFLFFNWEKVGYRPEQRVREVYVDEEKFVNEVWYRYKDLEVFAAPLRRQTVQDNELRYRTVQCSRVETRYRTDTVTTLRQDWTCYRAKAVKELVLQLSTIPSS